MSRLPIPDLLQDACRQPQLGVSDVKTRMRCLSSVHETYNRLMHPETAAQLLELNRRFYQSFARPFAETRQRPQPGVLAVAERIPQMASVLDLACGTGGLAVELARANHQGAYLGIDAEPALLAVAEGRGRTKTIRLAPA